MMPPAQDQWKQAAAEAAARIVEEGMVVGLGTGSTAMFFLRALARRIAAERLRVVGIPTSEQTAALARELKIPLTTFAEHAEIDLAFDGADEVELGNLYLIKGRGGAMLREKIVAAASKQLVVLADETKIVERLGSLVAVPVEVVQFGWQVTERRLKDLNGNPSIRLGSDGKPCLTDGGNFIIDCAFGPMQNPKEVAHHLDHVIGGVEHGLFLKFVEQVFVGGRDGVKVLRKTGSAG
jgi:ribose 5-phosphate isomerase A